MQYHIDNYEDEWVATLKDPERLKRFRAFVNEPEAQDETSRLYVLERDQIRPATPEELAAADAEDADGPVLITGAKIPVGAPA